MKRPYLLSVLFFCAFGSSMPGFAQSVPSLQRQTLYTDLTVLYMAGRTNTNDAQRFWMQGGSAELHARFWKGLGVVARVDGLHNANMHGSAVGLDLVTTTFGPRYSLGLSQLNRRMGQRLDRQGRWSFEGQALGGVANGMHSLFPQGNTVHDASSSAALIVGGGVNYRLTPRWSIRAFDGSWLRTSLPNTTTNVQNQWLLGSGVSLRLP